MSALGEHRVGHVRQVVGDEDLLEEAPDDRARARRGSGPAACVRGLTICGSSQLGAQDRAGDQMREIRDEHREVAQIPARLDLAPVHVDHVAHRDERVERDADGQHDVERRVIGLQAGGVQQRLQAVGEEIEVLEEAEHRQVEARG